MSRSKWKRGPIMAQIWVDRENSVLSPIRVEGVVLGETLGVHKIVKVGGVWDAKRDGYTITQLNSGARVPGFGHTFTQAQAKRIAERLDQLIDFTKPMEEVQKVGAEHVEEMRVIIAQEVER